ncbi:hypothetical protein OG948_58095 (plasmid) [Embleya sp. NBC_00888]|uniref:hypothetical protein n=1 Tax=Embleya sp. NBC_00888 TaxID=2975960 RepID=UPI002F917A63|nr:hypothetical protein OG948_58095 [Embleya sp. NBC_00888]
MRIGDPERWAERWEQLTAIAPDWNPMGRENVTDRWSMDWQRMLAVVRMHLADGGSLAELTPGHTAGGERVGAWLTRQLREWAGLSEAQQRALSALGAGPVEAPAPVRAPDR